MPSTAAAVRAVEGQGAAVPEAAARAVEGPMVEASEDLAAGLAG